MKRRHGAVRCLVALFLAASAAATDLSPVDPEELAALLAELEAGGGIITGEDLALFAEALRTTEPESQSESEPEPGAAATGLWTLAVDLRPNTSPRLDSRLSRNAQRVRLGARWRGDGGRSQTAAWLRTGTAVWCLTAGAGSLAHGSGLLTAPLGARSSLGVDSSLLPPAGGWRPSLAASMPQRLQGINARLASGRFDLECGVANDHQRHPAQHVRLNLRGERTGQAERQLDLGLLGLRRGEALAAGVDLRWGRGPWRLAGEAGAWRLAPDQAISRAWSLSAGWRQKSWRAEFQAAVSLAPGAMPGAQRPASLPGWHGKGWAGRLQKRSASNLNLQLAMGSGEDRQSQQAAGRLRTRDLLALAVTGRWAERGTWELRWRCLQEARRDWDPLQPWLPAQEDRRRLRTWWSLQARQPVGKSALQVSWRRLEESGQARNLLGIDWRRSRGQVSFHAGWQAAWGQSLDLVTVSAPVSSLISLRHWGSWDSGLLLGCEGRGRWRWQLGGELRRRSATAGGDLVGEGRLLWGRSF